MKRLLFLAIATVALVLWFRVESSKQARRVPAAIQQASLSASVMPKARPVGSLAEPEQVSGSNSLERAAEFARRHRDEWQVQPFHELRPEAYDSLLGSRVVYRVYQDGLPILGMEIEIEIDRDGRARLERNDYRPVKRVELSSIHPLPLEQILGEGSERLGALAPSVKPASVLYLAPSSDEPELAYALSFQGKGPRARQMQALLRATDGQLLARTASRSEF